MMKSLFIKTIENREVIGKRLNDYLLLDKFITNLLVLLAQLDHQC